MTKQIFWIDGFEGTAQGGYFIRSELSNFLERLRAQGEKPVGIAVDDSRNLEVLIEAQENE